MKIVKNMLTSDIFEKLFDNSLYSTTQVRKYEENFYPEIHRFRFEITAGDGAKLLKHIKRNCDIDCIYNLLAGKCNLGYMIQLITEIANLTELGDSIHVLEDQYVIRRVA